VTQHDNQANMQVLSRILEAAENGIVHNVAGNAYNEQVAEAFIEHQLRRYTGIGTAQDGSKRMLPLRNKFVAQHTTLMRVLGTIGDIAPVAFDQQLQRLLWCFVCRE
jgi:hypothetical protein